MGEAQGSTTGAANKLQLELIWGPGNAVYLKLKNHIFPSHAVVMESYKRLTRQSENIKRSPPEMMLCLRSGLVSYASSKQTHKNDKTMTKYNMDILNGQSIT